MFDHFSRLRMKRLTVVSPKRCDVISKYDRVYRLFFVYNNDYKKATKSKWNSALTAIYYVIGGKTKC